MLQHQLFPMQGAELSLLGINQQAFGLPYATWYLCMYHTTLPPRCCCTGTIIIMITPRPPPQHSAQADCRDQGCYQAQGCYQEPIQLERTCGGTSISQYSVLASVHYQISYERAGDHERCCDGMLDASSPFAPKTEARCPSRPGSWTVGRKKICYANRGVL